MSRQNSRHVKRAILVVGNILDNMAKLMSTAVLPPEAALKIWEKTIDLGEFLQFHEDDFLTDFTERG